MSDRRSANRPASGSTGEGSPPPNAAMSRASRITLRSPLDCDGCGCRFKGTWTADRRTSDQQCPQCAHVFTATWKGWTFVPEQIVIPRERRRRPRPASTEDAS